MPDKVVDLSLAESELAQGAGSKLTVHKGFAAITTIEGADTIKEASLGQKLNTPLATALILVEVPDEPCALYGIPTLESNPSLLKLVWSDRAEEVRCNMRRLFTLKKIAVPKRTRMVIHLDLAHHETYGPCVKLWWNEESFVPITPRPRSEKKASQPDPKKAPQAEEQKGPQSAENKG